MLAPLRRSDKNRERAAKQLDEGVGGTLVLVVSMKLQEHQLSIDGDELTKPRVRQGIGTIQRDRSESSKLKEVSVHVANGRALPAARESRNTQRDLRSKAAVVADATIVRKIPPRKQ
jgi:hypothetical protein